MDEYESLSHSKWECKYHVVFIPKCRRKVLYGSLRKHLGEVFRRLAEQRESRIEEGHLQADHVHMMSRFGKFGQRDKWKSCSLIAIKMAETRSNDDSTSTSKSHSDLQGEGGHGRPEGGKDPGRVG
jgi:REP element-mobilizing transposase RayT